MAEELNPIELARLVAQVQRKHSPELMRLIELNVWGTQLCAIRGHDMHLMVSEAVRCYCIVHGIGLPQLQACAEDMDKLGQAVVMQTIKQEQSIPAAELWCAELLAKHKLNSTPPKG